MSHQLINQTSLDTEIYTPPIIIEASRATLGGTIDLDPASSLAANVRVRAKKFFGAPEFTEEPEWGEVYVLNNKSVRLPRRTYLSNGGLDQPWDGHVWMNHPFGRPQSACLEGCRSNLCAKRGHHLGSAVLGNASWVKKIIREFETYQIRAACMICFASTSEGWFRPLMAYPQCFLSPRTNYLKPDGTVYKGVTKGSVVTYFGADIDAFAENFKELGETKVSYQAFVKLRAALTA